MSSQKVTSEGRIRPVLSAAYLIGSEVGPSGQVLVSDGSNSVAWGSNIATIWSNGSNQLLGPHVNFASGSNVHFAAASNTLTIHAVGTGGGAAISGITVKDEGVSLGAEATTLDFVGAGVSASGSGSTKTITISGTGSGFEGHEDFWTPPDSAGTFDQEFAGTADTLPSGFSWTTEPTGSNNWKLNSQWKRALVINRAASDTTTFDLRYAMSPGAIDVGFWWYMALGMGRWNNNTETIEVLFRDSSGNAGFGIKISATSVLGIASRDRTGGVTSDVAAENAANNDTRMGIFCGVTRKTSDNTWRAYISGGDGRHWEAIGVTTTRSVTIDHMQATFTSGGNQGFSRYIFGPLRSRADLLPWAPR